MKCRDGFRSNDWPTLGVEIELQLLDAETMALKSAFADVIGGVPESLHDSVKPEFMQCYVEINTGVCRTVADVGADLAAKVCAVERAADAQSVDLLWAATHPFSGWRDQQITPNERYYKLADLLGETVVRPVTFGLHVHVGVDSGNKAIRVMDRLRRHLPLLLALSANSPFWHGRPTGHQAHRIEVLEGFPSGGLPPVLGTWGEYSSLVAQMKEAGFIESHRELWWDVRPCAENGTVEVRICDMPADLDSVLGLTALIQCLVHRTAQEIDRAEPDAECHPLMIRQNRWRAARFGLEAELVESPTLRRVPAREAALMMVDQLRDVARELGCEAQLETLRQMAGRPTGAERQLALFEETGDLVEAVRRLARESRLSPSFASVVAA